MSAKSAGRPSSNVRVRFAPSPSGYLHVGGARTALFNWLFARKHGGVFILRIEDTDLERSSKDVIESIIEGMTWLGLDWDEGPFLQSTNVSAHRAAALKLQENDHAYPCFCTPEALKVRRDAAGQIGGAWKYERACLHLPEAEKQRFLEAGTPYALRFRVPDGETTFNDFVHGVTTFQNAEIEDFVLLRSDGSPTYHLSVVSDDISMGITHIIRGDDHISNTPKQILLYRSFGAETPTFGHLPLILGPDKKRMSKRHGAVSVLEYRTLGILPDAMFNFLALLGWSPGDDREMIAQEDLIRSFSFEGIGRAGAVFDLQKLLWLNGQYISQMGAEELAAELRPLLEKEGLYSPELEGARRAWYFALIELLKSRARTLLELIERARPFLSDEFAYDEDAVKKHLTEPGVRDRLAALRLGLASVEEWSQGSLEEATRRVGEEMGITAAKLIHPARVALTGKTVSPGIFQVMETIGRERALRRLDRLVEFLAETVH